MIYRNSQRKLQTVNNFVLTRGTRIISGSWLVWAVFAFRVGAPASALGDQLLTVDRNIVGISISKVSKGQVEFRTAAGQPHALALDLVKQFVLADDRRFADFNEAERLLVGGDAVGAILRYRRARRGLDGFWKDVASARLVVAFDRADRFDDAVGSFIRVVRSPAIGPVVAARLMPVGVPTTRNSRATRAIEQLNAAIASRPGPSESAVLTLLRFDIIQQIGDGRLARAAKRVAAMALPPDLRNTRFYKLIYIALSQPVFTRDADEQLRYIDQAILDSPPEILPDFLLLKGRTLMARASSPDDIIRATWPFMRVAIHMPTDARAADGLYETGQAMEKLGRPAKALELYRECVDHPQIHDKLKQRVLAEIDRLTAK